MLNFQSPGLQVATSAIITSSPQRRLLNSAVTRIDCATQYAHNVARGICFLYVFLQADIPMAMVELNRDDRHTKLSQLKGPCNGQISEELTTVVHTWFDAA